MPGNPSFVQVQPNSTGQEVETVLVTQVVPTGTMGFSTFTVGRQVIVGGHPNFDSIVWNITSDGELQTFDTQTRDVLLAILQQMRIQNNLIIAGFAIRDKLESLEADQNTLLPANASNFATITRH